MRNSSASASLPGELLSRHSSPSACRFWPLALCDWLHPGEGPGARGGVDGAKVAAIGGWANGCSVGGFVDPVGGGGNCGGTDAGSMSAPRAMGKPSGHSTAPTYVAESKVE